MLSLSEIEKAVDRLTAEEKRELHRYLEGMLQTADGAIPAGCTHSVLEIRVVRLGSVLRDPCGVEDLLGEMLEERR